MLDPTARLQQATHYCDMAGVLLIGAGGGGVGGGEGGL